MIEYEQLWQLCRFNRVLLRENERLRSELCDRHEQIAELEEANAELVIERDAADAALDLLAAQE